MAEVQLHENPCGGVRWLTLEDGTIEVEGQDVPVYAEGSADFESLRKTWENWTDEFRGAAEARGVLASWLVAIATQETGHVAGNPERQRTIESSDGHGSIGIMQPLASFARQQGYDPDDRYDPAKNIDMGAIGIAKRVALYGPELPLVSAAYNAGSARCSSAGTNSWGYVSTGNYIGRVVKFNNTAILSLGVGLGPVVPAGGGSGLLWFLVGGALVYLGWRWVR